MKISFDIDNTLVPFSDEFEVEHCHPLLNLLNKEKLRLGTKNLFKILEDQNHEIWIYTTSIRSLWKLNLLFAKYGLRPNGFINERLNQEMQKQHNSYSSKNPKLFNIDLHVDDSPGVKIEGEKFGFATVIVQPSDKNWTETVLERVNRIQRKLEKEVNMVN